MKSLRRATPVDRVFPPMVVRLHTTDVCPHTHRSGSSNQLRPAASPTRSFFDTSPGLHFGKVDALRPSRGAGRMTRLAWRKADDEPIDRRVEHCPGDGVIGWLCEQPCRERRSASGVCCRLSFQLCAVDAERNVDVATSGIRVSGSARGLGALRITFSAKELRPSISRRLGLGPHDGCPDDAVVAVPDHADDHHPISDGQPRVLVLRDAHQIDADAGAEVRLHGHPLAGDPLHAPVETDRPLLRYRGLSCAREQKRNNDHNECSLLPFRPQGRTRGMCEFLTSRHGDGLWPAGGWLCHPPPSALYSWTTAANWSRVVEARSSSALKSWRWASSTSSCVESPRS